jgi:hypothetical protein
MSSSHSLFGLSLLLIPIFTGFPPTKQPLASDSAPLALARAPKKTGQKAKVKPEGLIYLLC